MFFSLGQNLSNQRCVTNYPRVEPSFRSGRLIDASFVDSPIRVTGMFDRNSPPSHFEVGVIPILSDTLIEVLRSGGVDNMQTFPAVIVGDDGTEWNNYQAVQVIGIVRCANLDASDYSVIGPGDGDGLPPLIVSRELEIDPGKVPADLKLFRLAEEPSVLIASDTLVAWLGENKPDEGWGITAKEVC